jgi:hypothetical protein
MRRAPTHDRLPRSRHSLAVPFALTLVLITPSIPRRASAQTGDTAAAAEALFRDGREAMRKHEYLKACDKFRESDAMDPSPGTRLNWALCSEAIGQLAQALERARWALDHLDSDDDRRPIASRVTVELERRVSRLTLRLSPDSGPLVRVYLDDEPVMLRESDSARAVNPGKHAIFVEEPGRPTARFIVTLHEGEAVAQTVAAGRAWISEHEADRSAMRPSPRVSTGAKAGYALAGVGAAGVVTTVVMAVLAADEHRVVNAHCPEGLCDVQGFDAANRGRAFAGVCALSLGIGAASAVGATILLWPRSRRDAVSVIPRTDGAIFSVGRGF